MVHDEKNEAKPGDTVAIVESRPLSRRKRWTLKQVVRQAAIVSSRAAFGVGVPVDVLGRDGARDQSPGEPDPNVERGEAKP